MADVDISLGSANAEVNAVKKNPTQVVPAIEHIEADLSDAMISTHSRTKRDQNTARRMRRTTFQARLGRKLDRIHQQVLDNNIRLSSNPTDMLRIEAERDERSRDLISRTLIEKEILPIILPAMKDIPLRHLMGTRGGNEVLIPALYTIDQQEYFEIYAPVEVKLNPEDLLIRIIYDDINSPDDPYIMVLQVSEQLATIGYSGIRYYKYWCTFYNEQLPQRIIDIVKEANKKRAILGW